jgi:precorrin-2 dehydrogenase/sirohydrochlorin ferrochelatase
MSATHTYPIFLTLRDLPVLIVGGGSVALRKARDVIEAGAIVTVISPHIQTELACLNITPIVAAYLTSDLDRARFRLVFAATDQPAINEKIAADAAARGILCARADDGNTGDFSSAATIRTGGLTIAIATAGGSPRLAKRVSAQVAAALDPVLVLWSDAVGRWRRQIKDAVQGAVRRSLLERLGSDELEAAIRAHGIAGGDALIHAWIAEAHGAAHNRSEGAA